MTNEEASVRGKARTLKSKGRLIPFVGAGVSANLSLPTAEGLKTVIARELDWDPDVFRLCGDLPQLAQYFVALKGSIGPLRSRLDRDFQRPDDQVSKCRSLMALAEAHFPLIYTTNFDRLIEQAHRIRGIPFRVVSKIDDFYDVAPGHTIIVKFHGSFDDDDSLVLTEENYLNRLGFDSPFDLRLRSDTLGGTLLFIGYSFRDVNIRYMVHRLRQIRRSSRLLREQPPIAIMTTLAQNDIEEKVWAGQDVLLEALSPEDMDSVLAEFLRSIA